MTSPFTPIHLLLSQRTPAQWEKYWAAFELETPFLFLVRQLIKDIQSTKAQRIILSPTEGNQDRRIFLAGLLSGFATGIPVILPHSASSGIIEELRQTTDFLFTGILDVDDKVQTEDSPFPAINPDAATLVFFTSGSTGQSKPITKTLRQLETEIHCLERLWGHPNRTLTPPKFFSTVPHYHIYGLLFSLLWPVCARYPIYRQTLHFWEDVVNVCTCSDILISSPSHLERFPPLFRTEDLFEIKAVFSSGGPLSHGAAQTSAKNLGVFPLEIYGSTETGGIAYRQQDNLDQQSPKPWTPFPQMSLQTDERQCLRLESPYLPQDGFFQTEDKIQFLEDNTFILMGRADRIVKVEGKRLSLDELEGHLEALREIKQAKIIPLPNSQKMLLGGVLVLSPTGEENRRRLGNGRFGLHLRQSLKNNCDLVVIPKHWRFVEKIPQNAQGKTPLLLLQSLFASKEESYES